MSSNDNYSKQRCLDVDDSAVIRHFEFLDGVLAQAPVAIYACNTHRQFTITYASAFVTQLLGYAPHEILNKPDFIIENIHLEDLPGAIQDWNRVLNGQQTTRKYRFKAKNGQWKWLRDRSKPIYDRQGELVRIVGAWTDIQELISIEESLRTSEERHRFLLEHIHIGVLLLRPDGKISFANSQAAELLGYGVTQLLRMNELDFEGVLLNEDGTQLSRESFPITNVIKTHQSLENYVLGVWHPVQPAPRWLMVNAFPQLSASGEIINVIVSMLDVSERIKSQEKIHQLAYYDVLTQLPNRFLTNLLIDQAVQRARRESQNFALLFLDLDGFKLINDSMGHQAGDQLLQQIAERLKEVIRKCDAVGRLGGDEFVILLNHIEPRHAARVAEKIDQAFSKPFVIDNYPLFNRCSIGISIFPKDGEDAETLIKHADIAMYHAKATRRGEYRYFSYEMNAFLEKRLMIERGIYQALQDEQFLLHYQPQIDQNDNRIVGLEALIRWQHPERGMISPQEFIPVAEQSGQIHQIGLWVLQQACKDIKIWKQQGISNVSVAINLSFRQLQEPRLISQITDIIHLASVQASDLELELTESIMMENPDTTLNFIKQCRALGMQLAIDDFGTGYSSLSYLTKLPLSKIKIDRSFIKDIMSSDEANTVVNAIIKMAKSLRLNVVAEGVETQQQMDYLKHCGCEVIQGYFYCPPVDFEKITQLLKSSTPKPIHS